MQEKLSILFGKKLLKTLDKVVSLRWLVAVPSVLFGEKGLKSRA
jgi:hypothetical protein